MHRKVLSLFSSVWLSLFLRAADDQEKSLAILDGLLNSPVISASKIIQDPSTAPAKVVVITAQDIRVRGYMDLEELLHDLGGIDFNKGRGVEWSTIFMRGVRSENSDRFLLIWDGVLQTDVWKANNWISRQYPLSCIDRIEVMYGASSLLYGANAFSGIINVILKSEANLGRSVSVQRGSYDTNLVEVSMGQVWDPDWRVHFLARSFTSQEWDIHEESWTDNAGRRRPYGLNFPDDYVPSTDPKYGNLQVSNGMPTWVKDGLRQPFDGRTTERSRDWFIQAGVGYKGLDLRVQSWRRSEAQDPWYIAQKRMKGVIIPTGNAISLNYQLPWGEYHEFRCYAHMRTCGLDGDTGSPTNSFYIKNNPADSLDLKVYQIGNFNYVKLFNREYRLGSQFTFNNSRIQAVLGTEYVAAENYEDYNSRSAPSLPWNRPPRHSERDLALFVNLQGEVTEFLSLAAGIRYDYNYHAGERGGFGHLFTPRLAALLVISPEHKLRIISSNSFQAPSAWAKFSSVTGYRQANPDLKPEKLQSMEAIYTWNPNARWQSSVAAYYTQIDNSILLAAVPGNPSMQQNQNIGGMKISGVEIENRFAAWRGCSMYLNATVLRSKDRDKGRNIGDISPLSVNAGLDWILQGKWGLSLRTHYVAQRDTINWDAAPGSQLASYSLKSVAAYWTADLTISCFALLPGMDLRLNLYNLANKKYYDPGPRTADGLGYNSAVIQPGFRAYLGITYQF